MNKKVLNLLPVRLPVLAPKVMQRQFVKIPKLLLVNMNLVELWILLSLLITIHIPQIIANILLNDRQRAVLAPLSLSHVVCSRDGREYG